MSANWADELDRQGVSVAPDEQVITASGETGKDYRACLVARREGDEYRFLLVVRPDLSEPEFQTICKEVSVRVDRLLEEGRDPDGWQERGDGDLQLWLTAYQIDPWLADRS